MWRDECCIIEVVLGRVDLFLCYVDGILVAKVLLLLESCISLVERVLEGGRIKFSEYPSRFYVLAYLDIYLRNFACS